MTGRVHSMQVALCWVSEAFQVADLLTPLTATGTKVDGSHLATPSLQLRHAANQPAEVSVPPQRRGCAPILTWLLTGPTTASSDDTTTGS